FDLPVERRDVLSAWSGLRPLVESHPESGAAASTSRLSRDHTIVTSQSGLVTITGGKWTTYRKMAEDTVDTAIEVGGLEPRNDTMTADMPLVGAVGLAADGHPSLIRRFGLPEDVARPLHRAYGSLAYRVREHGGKSRLERLVPGHPFIAAEVAYARDHEFACFADDVLARRLRLAFLDSAASEAARAQVDELLATGAVV